MLLFAYAIEVLKKEWHILSRGVHSTLELKRMSDTVWERAYGDDLQNRPATVTTVARNRRVEFVPVLLDKRSAQKPKLNVGDEPTEVSFSLGDIVSDVKLFLSGTNHLLLVDSRTTFMMVFAYVLIFLYSLELPIYALLIGAVFSVRVHDATFNPQPVTLFLIAFAVVPFIFIFIRGISEGLLATAAQNITAFFRIRLLDYRQSRANTENPAPIASQIVARNEQVCSVMITLYQLKLPLLCYSSLTLLICIIIGFVYSWEITLTAIGFGILYIFLKWLLSLVVHRSYVLPTQTDSLQVKTLSNHSFLAADFAAFQCSQYVLLAICYALAVFLVLTNARGIDDIFWAILAMLSGFRVLLFYPEIIMEALSSCFWALDVFSSMLPPSFLSRNNE
ncbi:hypothetical protein AB6A40_003935 [Gnathostoma spinigerum]|uniref:Uncharacterized protein n=1 Tax=Gnathostoma spinigerum TaxID=75299 RepID=A0ABD6EC47_9BILA